MPATLDQNKYRDIRLTLRELRKLYKERTATVVRRRGHAPSRWNRKQLLAALQQDDFARFDFFSVPPEIRNLIYEKMKEVYEEPCGYHYLFRRTWYPDLKNMRLTCRQANAEVSGLLYNNAELSMRVGWQLGPGTRPGIYTYRKEQYHSMIKDNGSKAQEVELLQSPILAHRKNPELSGLRYIVTCQIHINVAFVTDHSFHHRDPGGYLSDRAEREFQTILSKIIMEVKGLSKDLKVLKIGWGYGNNDRDFFHEWLAWSSERSQWAQERFTLKHQRLAAHMLFDGTCLDKVGSTNERESMSTV